MTISKRPVHKFISDPIVVQFSSPPALTKKPRCPDFFNWCDEEFTIASCLAEWTDFTRRGRMARNMQPQHAQIASGRGSWGVGRYYFDVRTHTNRCFRLYYDRAPEDAADRAGTWVLLAELIAFED
jgi:hypothetical protein